MNLCGNMSNWFNFDTYCVIASKWVPNLIQQAYYKLPKICFLNTLCRPNEKQPKFWCFTSTSPFYNIFTNGLSIWENFDWQFKDLWTYLFIITCLNLTKTLHLISSKNLSGEFYVTTASGFWTLPLIILLKMCRLIFQKNALSAVPFSFTTDTVPYF